MLGFVTKLSSAGLVYKHFGKELVAAATKQPADSPTVETTWLAVYKYFMEAVDGIDNGMHNVVKIYVVSAPPIPVHLLCECWTCSQNTLLSVQLLQHKCRHSTVCSHVACWHLPQQIMDPNSCMSFTLPHQASPCLTMPHQDPFMQASTSTRVTSLHDM